MTHRSESVRRWTVHAPATGIQEALEGVAPGAVLTEWTMTEPIRGSQGVTFRPSQVVMAFELVVGS